MKKRLVIFLAVGYLAIGLVGCVTSSTDGKKKSKPVEVVPVEEKTPEAVIVPKDPLALLIEKNTAIWQNYYHEIKIPLILQDNKPDIRMEKLPFEGLKKTNTELFLKTLADYINSIASSEKEKVKLAHDWICLNISYDFESFINHQEAKQDKNSVLISGLAVCEGFAEVYLNLCRAIDLEAYKVSGYARGFHREGDIEDPSVSNHAWNIVVIDGKKYLIDTTWDEGYASTDKETGISSAKKSYKLEWFMVDPQEFIYTHFPTDPANQLLNPPMTKTEFNRTEKRTPEDYAKNKLVGTNKFVNLPYSVDYYLKKIATYQLIGMKFSDSITDKAPVLQYTVETYINKVAMYEIFGKRYIDALLGKIPELPNYDNEALLKKQLEYSRIGFNYAEVSMFDSPVIYVDFENYILSVSGIDTPYVEAGKIYHITVETTEKWVFLYDIEGGEIGTVSAEAVNGKVAFDYTVGKELRIATGESAGGTRHFRIKYLVKET
jgi:transglutaminase-like putative cysteine protease